MEKYGYQPGLACGILAVDGTLGIMILANIALLVHAISTQQLVGDMFIAGIFFGLFTSTKGAAVGASTSGAYAFFKGMCFERLKQSLIETLVLSLLGAEALGYFISVSRMTYTMATWIGGLAVSTMIVLICISIMYFLLGLFMDALAILVITIPVVFPIILALGFDPIWFGVIAYSP